MARKTIDNIAEYRQHPRGPPPKRRTDFSVFLCSSSFSGAAPDAIAGPSYHTRDGFSNVATTWSNKAQDTGKGMTGPALVPYRNGKVTVTQLSDYHLDKMDQVDSSKPADLCSDRDVAMRTQEQDIAQNVESLVTQSSEECITPCLGERDNNTSDGFQDPSKEASDGKDRSRRQLFKSPSKKDFSNHQQSQLQQSSGGLTLSNSTELEDESSERGRGKRKRKPKVHLDESSNLAAKSDRKIRRFRIMRYLGLMAPVGSPF